jgi:hypothetical protein
MLDIPFTTPWKHVLRSILVLAVSLSSLGIGGATAAHATAASGTDTCGQLLAEAKERFMATLAEDGSVPATPETKAAALEYIRVSKLCYNEIEAQNSSPTLMGEAPSFIDDGGLFFDSGPSAEFVSQGNKWGTSEFVTPGGTVTYSFMGNEISFSNENAKYGNSVAIASLPSFQPCFITDIQAAFAAWQAVANIQFVHVTDSGLGFNAAGAGGDIRISAHYFDGPSYVLAHAYYPPPNGASAAGDLHFDSSEKWTCDDSGIDIGVVAVHEIGHSLGLAHENTSTLAVMDPIYNPNLHGLQSDDINGSTAIYGEALASASSLTNDYFAGATPFTNVPFSDLIDTTGATEEADDPQLNVACDGNLLNKGDNTVWYKYTPGSNINVSIDTLGSNYDTYIAVWTGTALTNLSFVACDDDTYNNLQSQLSLSAQAGTPYYIEVAGYAGYQGHAREDNPGGNLSFKVRATNTDITIGGALVGRYPVASSESVRSAYLETNNGPVKVATSDGSLTSASQRVIYGKWSYSEMMGLPVGQLAKEYLFPYYNNVAMNSQLRVSNVGGANTTIKVFLGSQQIDSYNLSAGGATRKNYTGKNSGPLRVTSSASNILATIRVLYGSNSYSELMGLPIGQLGTEYLFPYYNNVAMNSQLRVSNVGGADTTINVYLGSNPTPIDSYPLAAGGATRKNYTGKNSGPLRVTSSASNILASIRVLYDGNSFSELMGFPAGLLGNEYWYPVYDNVSVESQLRVSNVGSNITTITVYAGTEQIDQYTLAAGGATRKNYTGRNTGPLHVVSSSQPVLTTIRMLSGSSFYEMTGLPNSQLSTQYFFPWYNNVAMDSEIRFAAP